MPTAVLYRISQESPYKCPKCGAEIRWSCNGDRGYAKCARHPTATRTFKPGELDGLRFCNWSGSTRRKANGDVEILYEFTKKAAPENCEVNDA